MSEGLIQSARQHQLSPGPSQDEWGAQVLPRSPARHPIERIVAALKRYKWIAASVVVVSVLAGVIGLRFLTPQYEVQATIWIESETPKDMNAVGPIRSQELLNSSAWVELFRSYRISDAVVRELALYIEPERRADAPLFRQFALANRFAPGQFHIDIDAARKTWILKGMGGNEIERGAMGDSIGRRLGWQWVLPQSAFASAEQREVTFTLTTPRETSNKLIQRVNTKLVPQTNFLRLTYRDPDPQLAARTLNLWANEYVSVAGELKKRNMVEFSKILGDQLEFAQRSLVEAERALETFRVNTITLPTEGGPVAGGVELSKLPAMNSFFTQKIEYDNLKNDREAVEKTIASAQSRSTPYEGLLLIPNVAQSPGSEALRDAFRQQYQLQAELTANRQAYTEEHPVVRDLVARLSTLQQQTIPSLAQQLLVQLRERERDYERRIAGASREIQSVPPRTIEEMRLRRAVMVAEGLYTNLKSRYAEASLAEASAAADVSVLDSAVAPLKPTRNTAPSIIAMAILGGIAAAVALAMLLDRVDPRFRYPEQATHELGLPVAGVVPQLPKRGINAQSPEQVMQLVEAFRTLRMHVVHAVSQPVVLAVSSAAPSDGKSLVAANLAMSFAEAGFRTVLIDGDTRRGTLHQMFAAESHTGFTEYLGGDVRLDDVLVATGHERLTLVTCGRRHQRSPELLSSPRLTALVGELRGRFDVIIFDTPPLAAGIDGYAISTVAGNLLLVLRVGHTERRLAAAKLNIMDRLPVNVIGTVLNGVALEGEFQYYAYSPGYQASEELPSSTPA